ncbi:MAG TPA: FTR1 family protein [bacterium]|nr:FTR1 family protein [bacterium]
MLQAFIVVFREGFEGFLIAAIILAYLKKTEKLSLLSAVYWGIAFSILASAVLGYLLWQGANGPLWEGIFGVISAVLIGWLVIHMWRTAAHLKEDMENHMTRATEEKTSKAAYFGTFLFTAFMISREGMETALLLMQIHEAQIVTGIFLGILSAASMAFLWARFGHLINLKRFFQVTSIFLLLFVVQIIIYSFHEFTEAGILPNSDWLHAVTEPYSPEGLYGKWFTLIMIAGCALWLLGAWAFDKISKVAAEKPLSVSSAVK